MHATKPTQRPENRKYHVIYKTTCLDTNKYYYGMHSTDNINDGYLGSGWVLAKSIKKYGKENHKYEILEYLSNRKELAEREKEIITEEMRKDPLCMNLRGGGTGNYLDRPTKDETREKLSTKMKGRKITWANKIGAANKGKKRTPEMIEALKERNTGRVQSEEEIAKRTETIRKVFAEKARPVIVDGIEYADIKVAARELDISPSTLGKRLTSQYFHEWYYKDSTKVFIEKVASCSKTVVANGTEYANKVKAAEALDMTMKMITTRIKSSKYPGIYFKDSPKL